MLNHRHSVMKVIGFILLIFCIQGGFYEGYCIEKGPVAVVREMDLCFGPVPLPLNEKTKNELRDYLRSGGDKRNTGPAGFYLHKKKAYEELIYFLSSKGMFRVSDLFTMKKGLFQVNPGVSQWFKGPVVLSIIDATEKRPLSETGFGPLAVSDGYFWWIFYRDEENQIVRLKLTIR
jgi:hypothetical protein